MSEFEAPGATPAADPSLAAQLSGPWMKALLADEDEAAGTDLFSQLTPTPATPQPASGICAPHCITLPVNALEPRSAVQGKAYQCLPSGSFKHILLVHEPALSMSMIVEQGHYLSLGS